MRTSGDFSISWRLLIAYKWFVPPPVAEVVPLGLTLSSGATEEDWALLSPLSVLCLLVGHSLTK